MTPERESRLYVTLCAVGFIALVVLAVLESVGMIHGPQ